MLSQPAQGPKAHWHFWGEEVFTKSLKAWASRLGGFVVMSRLPQE
jgi:hypothetical protein